MAREMTPDEVRKHTLEIQARAEKARMRPWRTGTQRGTKSGEYEGKGRFVASVVNNNTAAFIAAARSDIPWLCEELLERLGSPEGTTITLYPRNHK